MYFSYKSIIIYKKKTPGDFCCPPGMYKKGIGNFPSPFHTYPPFPYAPGIIGKILLFFKSLNMIWMENDDVIIYFSWSLPWENVQWGAPTGSLLREEAHKKKRTQKSSKKSFCKILISKRRKRWEQFIVWKFQLFFFTSSLSLACRE